MNGIFAGKHKILLDVVDSTNNYAAQLLKAGLAGEGTLIMAREQTAGRGQHGAQWYGGKDESLLCSLVFKPGFLQAEQGFYLNMMAALAIAKSLASLISDVRIKWPNDIMIKQKKVAGILIENLLKGSQIVSSIVGFGINLRQKHFSFTPYSYQPTSLAMQGLHADDELLIANICTAMEKQYLLLRQGNFDRVQQDFNALLAGKNQQQLFIHHGQQIEGQIFEVDARGRLCLMVNGEIKCFRHKEINWLPGLH